MAHLTSSEGTEFNVHRHKNLKWLLAQTACTWSINLSKRHCQCIYVNL